MNVGGALHDGDEGSVRGFSARAPRLNSLESIALIFWVDPT
ncbi:hypothetical protein FB004_102626 [Sinorhizobium medicae]|nr:hypothetical protein FB004_102626 [Sinorhizobium medicae]